MSPGGAVFARSVGRNLRRARQEAGLTKHALAERTGLHWTVNVAYEGGQGMPILESFVKIAYALGVSPCALLPGLEWDPTE
ncbi:MAG TPA: helix-turn-helix transcriptional regulator [Solirubrobacterales bacterium]